jgi:hypothetical protein
MRKEDLNLVSILGQSLWTDPEQSGSIARETVSAVSFLETQPERAIEKTAQALLDRANKKGMYTRFATGLNSLFPEERFILLALHSGRWSYERISRVVREPVEMVQSLAWNARVYLALSHYPAAPSKSSPQCPEYDPKRPWTQKIIDEEVSGQQKLFLQTHLSHCVSCREALMRAKEVYYKVQALIESQQSSANPGLSEQLQRIAEQGYKARNPGTRDLGDHLGTFFGRTEVRIVLLIWALGMLWLRFRS